MQPDAPPARDPFWGYQDLLIIFGLTLASVGLITGLAGLIGVLVPHLRADPTPLLLPMQFAVYGAIYIEFLAVFRLRYDKPVMGSLGWRRSGFNLGLAAAGGTVLAFAVSLIASLLHTPQVDSPMEKLMESPSSFIQIGIMAVTVAPLFEEMFFRGFLQPLISRSLGIAPGILITAALFGLLHAPEYGWAWQYAFAVAVAGAVFGWIRARTGSIIPGTVMHACYNAVFVVAVAAQKHYKH